MSDRVNIKVSITPIETQTDYQGVTHDIVASEVNAILGGEGDTVNLSEAYNDTAATQGYKDAAVNYLSVTHSAGGTLLTTTNNGDLFFIKNTGFKYSSATALGAVTTDCILVTVRINAYVAATVAGWVRANDAAAIHFIELGWLKPGQAMNLSVAVNNLSITQFGSTANDLTSLHQESGAEAEVCRIYVRTYQSDGTAALSANAVEFLCVD